MMRRPLLLCLAAILLVAPHLYSPPTTLQADNKMAPSPAFVRVTTNDPIPVVMVQVTVSDPQTAARTIANASILGGLVREAAKNAGYPNISFQIQMLNADHGYVELYVNTEDGVKIYAEYQRLRQARYRGPVVARPTLLQARVGGTVLGTSN